MEDWAWGSASDGTHASLRKVFRIVVDGIGLADGEFFAG